MERRKRKIPELYIRRRRLFVIAVAVLLLVIILLVLALRKPKTGTDNEQPPTNSQQEPDTQSKETDDTSKVSNETEAASDLSTAGEALDDSLEHLDEEDPAAQTDDLMMAPISTTADVSPNAPPTKKTQTTNESATDWKLLVVNKATPLPNDFTITTVKVGDSEVDKRIEEPLVQMIMAAKSDGINLKIVSAYRSVERQKEIYDSKMQEYLNSGLSKEKAMVYTEMYIHIPRFSEHHTGLAVDIVTPSYTRLDAGYANTAAAKWLKENAATYGFILRYPEGKEKVTGISFEPWHYRYVGKAIAEEIMSKGYCLEEYLYIKEKETNKSTRTTGTVQKETTE